jgi:hypothetical protein
MAINNIILLRREALYSIHIKICMPLKLVSLIKTRFNEARNAPVDKHWSVPCIIRGNGLLSLLFNAECVVMMAEENFGWI